MARFKQRKIFISLIFVTVIMTVFFIGCGSGAEEEIVEEEVVEVVDLNYPVTIGDVTIYSKPQAVISLSPTTTEMLFDMGYGDRVMGISEFCDYPEEALSKLRCGSTWSLDKETITMRPVDLVVTTTPLLEKDLIWFQQANVPVILLPYAMDFDGLEENYINLGIAMGGEEDGFAEGQDYYNMQMDKVYNAQQTALDYLQENESLHSILLREMSYVMATGETFEQQIFDMLCLVNEGEPYSGWLYPREEVVALEPHVIFCVESITAEEIATSTVYKPVKAVLADAIYPIDTTPIERQSPRMFDLIFDMSQLAYSYSEE